jgi:hypothetical protein
MTDQKPAVDQSHRCRECGSSVRLGALGLGGHETFEWLASPPQSEMPSKKLAKRLGRFELLERLGAGGFGVVYRAFDLELDRAVALKVPHSGLLDEPGFWERFHREARHVAQLRHPGIVSVYEVGTAEDTPFLVAELIDGKSLGELLKEHEFLPDEAAHLCGQIANALHCAHEAGIVHRDVKPGNVMIDREGNPHLMDFGLAKRELVDATISVPGQVLGTPAYMSPEQAAGDVQQVDCQSDIYSLGLLLYELLTGERPFRGTPAMLVQQALHDDPPPPRALNDRVPRDLELICLKAMSKQPEDRYPSARELADDLQRFLRREPVKAHPAGPLKRIALWCRHRNRILGASTVAMAMFVMLALWEGVSLVFLAMGVLQVEDPGRTAAVIVTGLICFSALAAVAWIARTRILAALWFGFGASVVLLGFSVFCLLGWIEMAELSQPDVRIPVFSFFMIAAFFVFAAHCVSLTAYYANQRLFHWARQQRLN